MDNTATRTAFNITFKVGRKIQNYVRFYETLKDAQDDAPVFLSADPFTRNAKLISVVALNEDETHLLRDGYNPAAQKESKPQPVRVKDRFKDEQEHVWEVLATFPGGRALIRGSGALQKWRSLPSCD